jgi:hypothetical protein
MVAIRCLQQQAKSRPSGQLDRPTGHTPCSNEQVLSEQDLLSAVGRKRINSDNTDVGRPPPLEMP